MRRLLIFLILAACARNGVAERQRPVARPPYVPLVSHVFVVVLENTDEATAEDLPFFTRLRAMGALLENYHGLSHPSQPNYIGMTAGSRYGITDDTPVTIDVRHIGDLIEEKGLTWKAYAENYPGDCYLHSSYGTQAEGQFVRRHVPFLEYANVVNDPARCNAHVVNADQFDADLAAGSLPNYSFYAPNNQHNGHDSSATAADLWLQTRFGPLVGDSRFMNDMLFVVTWDESRSSDDKVSAVLIGPSVKPGVESFAWYSHYNLLRTIEDALRVSSLGRNDSTDGPITDVWVPPAAR